MINRMTRLVLAGLALGAPLLAGAEPLRIAPSVPHAPPSTNTFSLTREVDEAHSAIGGYVAGFGRGMDAFLSAPFRDRVRGEKNGIAQKMIIDPAVADEANKSRVKVSPSVTARESDGVTLDVSFNAKLRLPRFSDRVELIVDSMSKEESVLDDLERDRTTTRPENDDSDGAAAIRYYLKETLNYKASVTAGLKFRPEPVPGLGLRLRIYHDFEDFTTRLTQSMFYETEDGFGEKTQFDLDQQERQNYLRRLTTTVLWSEVSDGVAAGQSFSYYKYLTRRRVAGFRVGVTGHIEPEAEVDNYNGRVTYRQRIHRDWLYLEIEPGVDWPRERDFDATPYIKVKFDIIFGDFESVATDKN